MVNAVLLLLMAAQFGQSSTGELRVTVSDQGGSPLQSAVTLVSEVNQLTQTLDTDAQGVLVAKRLPFGRYRIEIAHAGFETSVTLLEIESVLPKEYHVTLNVAPLQAQITVTSDATLLDVHQSSTLNRIGSETLQRRMSSAPGRSLSALVNTQPGWLLEANGILHPRGSEYQVQYSIDGFMLTDNRSPAFAPELDADTARSITILTAGYPAEYGRKLGGVIEVTTAADAQRGFHGDAGGSIGSFGTATGSVAAHYGWSRQILSANAALAHTDRYLDPPGEENFTNSGTGSNVGVQFERDLSSADRVGLTLRHGRTRFLVPNERVQEEAGQR